MKVNPEIASILELGTDENTNPRTILKYFVIQNNLLLMAFLATIFFLYVRMTTNQFQLLHSLFYHLLWRLLVPYLLTPLSVYILMDEYGLHLRTSSLLAILGLGVIVLNQLNSLLGFDMYCYTPVIGFGLSLIWWGYSHEITDLSRVYLFNSIFWLGASAFLGFTIICPFTDSAFGRVGYILYLLISIGVLIGINVTGSNMIKKLG